MSFGALIRAFFGYYHLFIIGLSPLCEALEKSFLFSCGLALGLGREVVYWDNEETEVSCALLVQAM